MCKTLRNLVNSGRNHCYQQFIGVLIGTFLVLSTTAGSSFDLLRQGETILGTLEVDEVTRHRSRIVEQCYYQISGSSNRKYMYINQLQKGKLTWQSQTDPFEHRNIPLLCSFSRGYTGYKG